MPSIDKDVTHPDATLTLTGTFDAEGTIDGTATESTIDPTAGADTDFEYEVEPGDVITLDGGGGGEETHVVSAVSSTTITLVGVLANTHVAVTMTVAKIVTTMVSADINVGFEKGETGDVGNRRKRITHGNRTVSGTITRSFGRRTNMMLLLLDKGITFGFVFNAGNSSELTLVGCKVTGLPINIDGTSPDAIVTAMEFVGVDFDYDNP